MYLGDIYTISVNLAGLPGMTVPCGMDKNGLPIGLQLIADCFNEKKMIQTALSITSDQYIGNLPYAKRLFDFGLNQYANVGDQFVTYGASYKIGRAHV